MPCARGMGGYYAVCDVIRAKRRINGKQRCFVWLWEQAEQVWLCWETNWQGVVLDRNKVGRGMTRDEAWADLMATWGVQ